MSYFITKHCKERFLERIGQFNDVKELLSLVYSGKDITNIIFDKYPRYILYLYVMATLISLEIHNYHDKKFILELK